MMTLPLIVAPKAENDSFLPRFVLRSLLFTVMAVSVCILSACGGGNTAPQAATGADVGLSAAAQIGKKIFADISLSASGKMSCATCHDPSNAHAQTNNLSVQLGGQNLDVPGFRAVPSLRYIDKTPAFAFGDDGKPLGGFTRDGKSPNLAVQAETPFMAAHEMANTGRADEFAKLQRASYVNEFTSAFGANIFSNVDTAFERALFALQQYQLEDSDFHPYDSKYDRFLAGKAMLSDSELRGLALFNNPTKGNCAACHISKKGADGSAPLFTDFTFDNLGVPRNKLIPATAAADYFDMGVCGPDRTDLAKRTEFCGAFKVPTLRNVATRKVFFHNGQFNNLRDVVNFYVRRDTNPEEWFPFGTDGTIQKFNDLPAAYAGNVNVKEVPYNRQPGMAAALTPSEVEDVITFLSTLNDGYKP